MYFDIHVTVYHHNGVHEGEETRPGGALGEPEPEFLGGIVEFVDGHPNVQTSSFCDVDFC